MPVMAGVKYKIIVSVSLLSRKNLDLPSFLFNMSVPESVHEYSRVIRAARA